MVPSGFMSSGHLSFISQFSKNWHWLASTASNRKGAKFQYDISWFYQNNIFSKHQNKAEFKDLGDSVVLSINFPDLRTSGALMTSTVTFTASFHHNNYWSWWPVGLSLAPKWPIQVPLSNIQFFTDIWHYFCQRLLRPADVTFLKTGWWNPNAQYS